MYCWLLIPLMADEMAIEREVSRYWDESISSLISFTTLLEPPYVVIGYAVAFDLTLSCLE